jgi:hypothetical protein
MIKNQVGLLLAACVLMICIVFCGMIYQDVFVESNGIVQGISEIQQMIGQSSQIIQDGIAIVAVIVIILTAFFFLIPVKHATETEGEEWEK